MPSSWPDAFESGCRSKRNQRVAAGFVTLVKPTRRKRHRKKDFLVELDSAERATQQARAIELHNPDLVVDHEPDSKKFTINERDEAQQESR